jgi:hypothetical protein
MLYIFDTLGSSLEERRWLMDRSGVLAIHTTRYGTLTSVSLLVDLLSLSLGFSLRFRLTFT